MEELTRFVWGALAILALALAVVFGSAGALQGWQQSSASATVVEQDRRAGQPGNAVSSYWYGRAPAPANDDPRS